MRIPIMWPMSLSSSLASSISSSTWPQPRRFSIDSQSSSSRHTLSRWRVKLSTALRYPSSSGTALISSRVLLYRLIKTSLAFGTTSSPTIPVVSFTFAIIINGRATLRRNILTRSFSGQVDSMGRSFCGSLAHSVLEWKSELKSEDYQATLRMGSLYFSSKRCELLIGPFWIMVQHPGGWILYSFRGSHPMFGLLLGISRRHIWGF